MSGDEIEVYDHRFSKEVVLFENTKKVLVVTDEDCIEIQKYCFFGEVRKVLRHRKYERKEKGKKIEITTSNFRVIEYEKESS